MRRFNNVVALILAVPFLATLSCSEMRATGPDVETVSLALSQSTLPVGQDVTVTATLRDASGLVVDGSVTWSLSNPSIASLANASANTAHFTAMAAGNTQITATSKGQSGSAMLTVTGTIPAAVASVSVSLASNALGAGQTTQATATTRDANNNVLSGRSIAWSSSNANVATVSNAGVVTAVASGSAQIVATSEGQSGNATLTVSASAPPPVASVSVSLASNSLNVGQTTQATATTRDANNNVLTGRSIAWTSSNTGVATVSGSGLVTAAGAGSAQITATSEGHSGSATLTVAASSPPPVATVSVTLANSALITGETTQASATTRDANNNVLTGRVIAWSSSNTAVASVSASGLVTAAGPGSAQITATSEGKSGSATATVSDPPPPTGSAEPPGMTVITDRPFNSILPTYTPGEAGWEDWSGGSFLTVVQDATAPKSPSNVGQLRYPAGYAGGNAPGGGEYNLRSGGRNPTTLYIAMWVKLSSNWYGNTSSVNKICHVWISGLNRVVASATGEANNPLVPQIRLQTLGGLYSDGVNPPSEDANLNPNMPGQTGVKIIRGRWHKWEIVISGGTAGGHDGTVDWWIDGVQVGHYTGVPYIPPGGSNTWDIYKWDPTWGGIGGNIPADQFMWMDHIYISGKP